jgi:D-glycero-D-manno-heptose 1,7-bisphosphate phosphatase
MSLTRVRRRSSAMSKTDYRQFSLYLFDADGTLRRTTVDGQPCPNKPDEWELMPNVREVLTDVVCRPDADVAIVSNQGGVGLGLIPYDVAQEMLAETLYTALGTTVPVNPAVFMCPHRPAARCVCRKPSPVLLVEAMRKLGRRASETIYVGDQESDREAAARAGCAFAWAKDFFGWKE